MTRQSDDLVKYRFSRAKETLEEARLLAGSAHWNACVNRLYYACYYAVTGLLAMHGLSSSKHSGVRSIFNRHFVKTEKISKELAQTYNDLFERRREGDYEDFLRFDEIDVRNWMRDAELFIKNVSEFIEK